MNVLIHCGLNKTGSTSLQSAFERAFHPDANKYVIYPRPHTTRGNAGQLLDTIRHGSQADSNEAFRNLTDQASGRNRIILLSCESLYHDYVTANGRDRLSKIQEINHNYTFRYLFIFRNVYTHCISCFAHRCGVHRMPQFQDWARGRSHVGKKGIDRYELWEEAEKAVTAFTDERFNRTFLSYDSSCSIFRQIEEVIGCSLGAPEYIKNPSVSLIEAEVLRHLFKSGLDARKLAGLRDAFKRIESKHKFPDSKIRSAYYKIIEKEIYEREKTFTALERLLNFSITWYPDARNSTLKDYPIGLTIPQVTALLRAFS